MSDTHTEPNIPVSNDDTTARSSLTNPFEVGDCEMTGASVTLTLNDPNTGDSTLTWKAKVGTRHTTTHDVWHQGFDFKTGHGHSVFSNENARFDGPEMDGHDPIEFADVDKSQSVNVDPDLFGAIRVVDWTAEC
jgi:hypothetical protein